MFSLLEVSSIPPPSNNKTLISKKSNQNIFPGIINLTHHQIYNKDKDKGKKTGTELTFLSCGAINFQYVPFQHWYIFWF